MLWQLLGRYHKSLLLLLVFAVPLVSMYYHGRPRTETSPVEKVLLAVTSPSARMTQAAVSGSRDLLRGYVVLTDTEARNRELERENRILLGEALRSRTQAQELDRVKLLCGFRQQRRDFETVPARVVGRDVSQFFQVVRLRLDVQGAALVREGQAVITHDGIVGRIEKLAGTYADVMLVTDARSQVHATVLGKGIVGSVKGKGKRNEFSAQFVYLDSAERAAPLQPGDAVMTTGHDRVFPAGLEVGHVSDVRSSRNGLYHEYVLAPAVAYASIEELLIVTDYRGGPWEGQPPLPAGKTTEFAPPMPPLEPTKPSGKRAVDPANTPDAPP
ncbi:MAG: rod shape-determining protein MreC [Myxococcales bacterium]|nr:rod shape-determining protein MreC [Myxococcales bacterium]